MNKHDWIGATLLSPASLALWFTLYLLSHMNQLPTL